MGMLGWRVILAGKSQIAIMYKVFLNLNKKKIRKIRIYMTKIVNMIMGKVLLLG